MNITKETMMSMLERMASYGTAPEEGCSIFGVGYEEAFSKIKNKYLVEQFNRGVSSEKFVIGPFGSGKTHFLRQLMEIARDMDCVTAEIALNKDIDFTKSLAVYCEVVRNIRNPKLKEHGISSLLEATIVKISSHTEDASLKDLVVGAWASGIDKVNFKYRVFGTIMKKALQAKLNGDEVVYDSCCRWLEGDINDRGLSNELNIPKVNSSSNNLYGKYMMLSLFQFIRYANYNGSVICFDEAEQGLSVDKKKTEKILSMLMAGIEAITNLSDGSALMVYALTPDLVDKMKTFAALQQRITSPSGRGFFDGNVLAPIIDLTRREPLMDLQNIGGKLVDVFYAYFPDEVRVPKEELQEYVNNIASDILENEMSSSNRRDMVKNVCSYLLGILETGEFEAAVSYDYFDSVIETEV